MASILVSQLRPGVKLSEDVHTRRSSLLMKKGKEVTDRDIEMLKAFFIHSVQLEDSSVTHANAENESNIDKESMYRKPDPFQAHYGKLVPLLKSFFDAAKMSLQLPVPEIRKQLETVLEKINLYNPLTFVPGNYKLEDYFYHHGIMVGLTSYMIANWSGSPKKDLMPIAMAGLIHNVGMIKADPEVLTKEGEFLKEDYELIKRHPTLGFTMIKDAPLLNDGIKLAALQHHEREDGSGYPLQRKSENIHQFAKIVAVADVFHAMTSRRFHRGPESPYLVLEQLFTESFGKLSPVYVQTFIQKVTQFHNGTVVKLNDGSIGEIVFTDTKYPTRPWVNVKGNIINLALERKLYIQEVLGL